MRDNPINAAARGHFEAALAQHRAGNPAAALAGYDAAIAAAPDYVDAHGNRAIVLAGLGDHEAALASFDRAVAINPGWVDGQVNRAMLLVALGRFEEAIAGYGAALATNPGHLTAAANKAIALARVNRHADAVVAFDRALALAVAGGAKAPAIAGLHCARGLSLIGRADSAALAFDSALALDPLNAEAWYRKGELLSQRRDHLEAAACFDRALELDPRRLDVRQRRAEADQAIARWDRRAGDVAALGEAVAAGLPLATPFPLLTLVDDPALHARAAALHVEMLRGLAPRAVVTLPPPAERLRIAYVSADFFDHATMHLMADMFDAHDRAAIEVTMLSLSPGPGDAMEARARAAADRFLEIDGMADAEVAALARRWGIDIAVDLKGFTSQARPGIFACRAAPVQVNFLGYPGTMAADYIDYLIADRVIVPDWARGFYREKLVRLPRPYQPNCAITALAPRPERSAAGLPDDAMVFASFNQISKLTPEIFAGWMQILKAVPGSVLWIWADASAARANLVAAAAGQGVAAERLVFAASADRAAHVARLAMADLILDSFPYGAHTTGSDALRAGVPIVTLAGQSFASRVAASLVTAMGLGELVTESLADYVALATALGRDRARLAALRQRLAAALPTAPLFDPRGFARDLEAAFAAMQARARAGLPPADIDL